MNNASKCDYCLNYIYDEEFECYICRIDLDEDEMRRFITNTYSDCPYYSGGDEYTIVRKQN